MRKPRTAVASFIIATLGICICLSISGAGTDAFAQQSATPDERERGVSSYQQGNDQAAIEALRRFVKKNKDDVSAWHYLGLALNRQGKQSDARKAHERAAKNGEQLLTNQFGDMSESAFFTLVSQIKPQLEEAADSADKYLELSSKPSSKKVAEWHDRAEFLRDFAAMVNMREGIATLDLYAPKDVTTKARLLSRPEPQYTEGARKHQVTGTVVLRAILAADGKVRAIRPIRMLPNGLTIQAIKAARQIKFVPATKDGRVVSQYIQLEYSFNLY